MTKRRNVKLVVISDTHLGTIGSRAKELHQYLKSIQPETIVLNGDIVDLWQFSKRHWNKYHTKVIKQILKFISDGVKVHYIAGNHDEALRRFLNFEIEGFKISNKLSMNLDGKKAWFFHGDVFDASIQHAKWIAKLGGWGYNLLILLNRVVNVCLTRMGKEKYSLSKKIKSSVKSAIKHISNFENAATDFALSQDYQYVVCGHIHQPIIREVTTTKGKCIYLNSGDWVESLTALEYHNEHWKLFYYNNREVASLPDNPQSDLQDDEAAIELTPSLVLNYLK